MTALRYYRYHTQETKPGENVRAVSAQLLAIRNLGVLPADQRNAMLSLAFRWREDILEELAEEKKERRKKAGATVETTGDAAVSAESGGVVQVEEGAVLSPDGEGWEQPPKGNAHLDSIIERIANSGNAEAPEAAPKPAREADSEADSNDAQALPRSAHAFPHDAHTLNDQRIINSPEILEQFMALPPELFPDQVVVGPDVTIRKNGARKGRKGKNTDQGEEEERQDQQMDAPCA